MKRWRTIAGLCLWLLMWPAAAVVAQSGSEPKSMTDELRAVREELNAFRRDLQEIKTLLLQNQRPFASPTGQEVVLRVENERVKGDRKAGITIIDFSDFECLYCGKFARETLPQIERDYIQSGKVRYAFRNYPLESLHRNALKAAEAAGCAEEQGRFWEMHSQLFEHQNALGDEDLRAYAKAARLDLDKFLACRTSGKHGFEVRKDIAEALRARVRGTPTFFLGLTDTNSHEVRPVEVIMGAQPYLAFKMAIERLLDTKK